MTMTSYPYTTRATTDAEYSRIAREWRKDGVLASVGAADLRVGHSGTGLVSALQPGSAISRGFIFRNTAVENLAAHGTAPTSGSRIDRIVLRLNLNNAVGERLVPFIIPGTAATTPSLPALVQNDEPGIWDFPLTRVTIPTNATTLSSTNYTDDREFIGGDVGKWTTSKRPASPRLGDFGFNVTLGYFEFWDGDSWERPTAPPTTWANIPDKPAKYPDADKIDGRELFVQTTQPVGVDGDLWIKI